MPKSNAAENTENMKLKEIPLAQLKRGRYQPRSTFSEEKLNYLAETIRKVGVLEPILIRPLSDNTYEIIAGERRWRSSETG